MRTHASPSYILTLLNFAETDRCTNCQCQVALSSARADRYPWRMHSACADRRTHGSREHPVPRVNVPSKRGGLGHMRRARERGAQRQRHMRRRQCLSLSWARRASHLIPMQRTQAVASGSHSCVVRHGRGRALMPIWTRGIVWAPPGHSSAGG
jgi:hypothetical protein